MSTALSESASEMVADHLASCLPPGTPPCYRSIVHAHYMGSGKKRLAVAELEMFDGQPATLEVFQWGLGRGHRWTFMSGGNAFFEDGRWQRDTESSQPEQPGLFGFVA